MNLGIDEYTGLDSPLHRWAPRYKLIGLMVLSFAFSFVRDLRLLLAMVVVTVAVYAISRLPVSFVLQRLRYPSFFLLIVVLSLPFLSGEIVIMSIGPVDMFQEGLLSVVVIAIRFLSIVTIGLVLFGTTPLLNTIKAMRALGLPAIMADMVLLAFRYLYEIGRDLRRMQAAMALRGFHQRSFSIGGLNVLAWLGGSILVRSYERSEWVYKAMLLRGYGQALHPQAEFETHPRDVVILVIFLLMAAGLVVGDLLYGHGAATLLK